MWLGFPNASEFKPERWLAADGTLIDDTPGFCFGFGRRFCPGKPLTEAIYAVRHSLR
ncbi:hypothetical protein BV22DRAFT_1034154 [Leucogyrophana mollusca]|uniref:Uncharacterized protein n=1 Tax=Leucogyrophana mollusca TaxID=85980 RepID=A0ACB8BJG0_9AGAM|nr:hypothetical protein BV22DRAFT_1034154 [Leucogyrophana mollusca]